MAEKKLCFYCMEYRESGSSKCPYCGKEAVSAELPPHYLRPGLELNNKYIVGRTLGEGGFGITYIGRDKNLDIRVAIKEYYPTGFVSRNSSASSTIMANVGNAAQVFEKGRKRFISEARIMAKFASEPGIVGVRDFFEANNTAYIIMNYLDGITLKEHLEQNGAIGIDQILGLLKPVIKSLERIHRRELIHRDISPDNLMLVDGELKLLDFGAARDFSNIGNKSLSVMLKPGYTPEEQYRSKGMQGPWTDIYALCATIYKCITGITPDDSLNRAFGDDIKPPSSLGVTISGEQEKALMQGMAILQKNRIQSVHELRDRLYGKAPITVETSPVPPVAKPEKRPVSADPNATVIGTPLSQTRGTVQERSKSEYAVPTTRKAPLKTVESKIPVCKKVPSGSFIMGSNDSIDSSTSPQHLVTLTNGFWMGIYPVTQGQWETVMGTTIQQQEASTGWGLYGVGKNLPIYYVSWYEAIVFCNKLSVIRGLSSAYSMDGSTDIDKWGVVPTNSNSTWDAIQIVSGSTGYRLPTEAQWEYAAKGGNSEPGNFIYSGSNNPEEIGWFRENCNESTQPVGLKQPNSLGLYDMSGNVWEWCWDWYDVYTSTAKSDPLGASSGAGCVVRGGSWNDSAQGLDLTIRVSYNPLSRGYGLGFRVLRP